MNIEIEPVEGIDPDDGENCIFCNTPTIYWAPESNRPVCFLCSCTYGKKDIDNAKYNY